MESEREVGRVHGLGRGSILGFSLVVTDWKIVGIDTRKFTVRLWLGMMLGIGLGVVLVVLVLFSGLEPLLFRINPLLSFVTFLSLVLAIPSQMVVLAPRFLGRWVKRTGHSIVQAPEKDAIGIEVRKPGWITEKGYFR